MKILIILVICGLIDVTRSSECIVSPNNINLALFGRVCQSSTFASVPRCGADRGVDGISETDNKISPCVITKLESQPWFTLDMEEGYLVGLVRIVLRTDDCWDCMNGVQLQIGDSPDRDNPVCATITEVSREKPLLTFFCNGMQGRYVTLIHAGHSGIISFCEIKVYQHLPGEQLSQGIPVQES
ncbi:pentraxin fusion protein-like [Rana temporaria]|uniref:pentraxin fusion protein-like n=1 Tax=Rana temporaria TaxID=8407 RepID=UPI001AAD725F|nr:pentraxin fusion protein-like [Rana temporaria]XP_040208042.1 pentraxin fusion protein-like [Rana temporaria]XP_040208043.1 pentraxin fusion protein-like [Rana temporaria]XP_040208044.1 pentraxin fusion protein-like [Rana temporaria]XP_040208045.1 pentraxin fusion protein-like [Rana temporaria]XP_040208046.1 pentraxin fusion protein-like [Rana temporaria]XP_040208048.1 pentraxin fusion protein-like [Rana temporaria]XP_040208049.1 pentraxin fusion protein-like [Rana temporaria]XP_04020805